MAMTVLYVFCYSLIWHYLTIKNNCSIAFGKAVTARVYSEFGKYVPGRALGLAMIIFLYDKEQKSKKLVSFCLLFEYVATVLGAVLVFLVCLYWLDLEMLNKYRVISVFCAISLSLAIHPRVLERGLNTLLRLMKRDVVTIEVSYGSLLLIVALNMANWLILGAAMYFLINAVYALPVNNMLFTIASFSFASFFGLLALFTPAGLGVRESILILLLAVILPKSIASVLSVLSRLWLLLAEGILFLIVASLNWVNKRPRAVST